MMTPEEEAKAIVEAAAPGMEERIAAAVRAAVAEERKRCANVASLFSINETSIHPDRTWAQMSETARIVCHTTCQQVAMAIRNRKD